jgi:hypothetical protein
MIRIVTELKPKPDRTVLFTVASTIVASMVALAGAIYGSTEAFIASQQAAKSAFDASMVQIGVSILSADPGKSDVTPAREWAIKLVEKHSGEPFTPADREDLLHHPINTLQFLNKQLEPFRDIICRSYRKSADGHWVQVPTAQASLVMERPESEQWLNANCN